MGIVEGKLDARIIVKESFTRVTSNHVLSVDFLLLCNNQFATFLLLSICPRLVEEDAIYILLNCYYFGTILL